MDKHKILKFFKILASVLLPNFAYQALLKLIFQKKQIRFVYGYLDWDTAARSCEGYNSTHFTRVLVRASRKVRKGEFAFERDGVGFAKISYDWNFLSGLLFASHKISGLNVVDFGGGLGSTYAQYSPVLSQLCQIDSWSVIEQKEIVDIGRQEFANSILSFNYSTDHFENKSVDLIIFGSVLQYLAKPIDSLTNSCRLKPKFVLLDRTPFHFGENDSIGVQIVPPSIYSASYPFRSFSYSSFKRSLDEMGLQIIFEWDSELQPDPRSISKGFLLQFN